jgi:hypothetical protein
MVRFGKREPAVVVTLAATTKSAVRRVRNA